MKRLFVSVLLIGLLVAGFLSPSFASAQSTDHPVDENETAYVDVTATILQTNPDIARSIDQPSLTNPVDLWKWTRSMTVDQKLWLTSASAVQTQALYGDKVTILKEKCDWVEIAAHGQPPPKNDLGYPGGCQRNKLQKTKVLIRKRTIRLRSLQARQPGFTIIRTWQIVLWKSA